ncbi:MAG TPA: AMP-binding protein [Nevskiaceae bacterium]|nr:AMP-binding protein [Nevskiaceae bacterium]
MNADALHGLSLLTLLEEHARAYPSRIAVAGDEGLRFTWPEFRDRVGRLASALAASGIGHGDRVLWLGQNSFRILEGILACARLGAIFCPANWRQSAPELAFVLDDLAPRIVFWQSTEVGAVIEEARGIANASAATRWIPIERDYEAFVANAPPRADASADVADACVALYTAAFEGRPNAALLSQRAFLAQSPVVAAVTDFVDRTVFLNSGPLFHIGTMKFMMAAFYCGGTNVFLRRTDPEAICQLIHAERCTVAFLVTKTMQEMAAVNQDRRYDLSCLVSQPVSPEWDAMVKVVVPPGHFDRAAGYGQTEVCGFALWQYYGGRGLGFHGRPSPVAQVRLLDDDGNAVPPGEVGEFAIRGPIVMNGYWNRPELNARRQAGGWHRCNDLGRQESDGSYTFIGPKTQMIKSGVENVYPAEVEACLKSHPAVADCGVIGVPDTTWIQSVRAIVALKPGARATEAELIEHCRARIASYKKPRSVVFVERIPRLPTWAVDYRALDAAHGGGGYPGGGTRSK